MAKELESLALTDIAPPSITGDKNVRNLMAGIDPDLLKVSEAISEAFIISRIDKLPEPVLDLLAWQWHVDFYELSHNIDAKREMVKGSIAWHRKKGTRWAIIKALEMLGVEARFISWQEEGAAPYTFAIEAKLTHDFWERVDWTKPTQTLRRAIEESKAARSWMSRLYVYMEASAQQDISIGTATVQGIQHNIDLVLNTSSVADFNIAVGGAVVQGIEYSAALTQPCMSESSSRISAGSVISCGIEITIQTAA